MAIAAQPVFPSAPLLQELLARYPGLPPAQRRVADFVLARPADVLTLSSSELAGRSGSGQPAVSRLCGRLSTSTYPRFKVRLAQELGTVPSVAQGALPAAPGDPLVAAIVEQTERDHAVALQAVATLDAAALRRAAQALAEARWVVTCGFDLSSSMAWRLASLLRRAGCRARVERDPHDAPWVGDLERGDALVVVSYRGNIPQFLGAIRQARRHGVAIIVLSNEARTELAALADVLLLSHAPAARTDDDYVTGRALGVQLAIVRALWRAVQAARPGRAPVETVSRQQRGQS
jgi:DNA-binding MurR/RpiR family transcriptional regulator